MPRKWNIHTGIRKSLLSSSALQRTRFPTPVSQATACMGTTGALRTAVQVILKPSGAPRRVTRRCSVRSDMGPARTGEGKSQSTSALVGAKQRTGRIDGVPTRSPPSIVVTGGANASDTSSPGRNPDRLSISITSRECQSVHACLSSASSRSVATGRGAGRGACTIPAVISIPSILSNTARNAHRCRRREALPRLRAASVPR